MQSQPDQQFHMKSHMHNKLLTLLHAYFLATSLISSVAFLCAYLLWNHPHGFFLTLLSMIPLLHKEIHPQHTMYCIFTRLTWLYFHFFFTSIHSQWLHALSTPLIYLMLYLHATINTKMDLQNWEHDKIWKRTYKLLEDSLRTYAELSLAHIKCS